MNKIRIPLSAVHDACRFLGVCGQLDFVYLDGYFGMACRTKYGAECWNMAMQWARKGGRA